MSEIREKISPYPLFRVITFGRFILEQLASGETEDGPHYEPVAEQVWRSRSAACDLFKFLLCRTQRRAPKDMLVEALWPDVEVASACHSFDTAISRLRNVLTPTGRDSLLITQRAGSTIFYELPSQRTLWADIDAFLALLSQADRASSQGHDPLPLLETAWHYASGIFLEDNLYSLWAQAKRQTINTLRHRVLHQLVNLNIQRGRLDQAELLLLAALEEEPTDEDSVCSLMSLLEQQGRRQDALRCYERLVTVLKEESETEPLPSTQALAQRMRAASLALAPSQLSTLLEAGLDIHVIATPHGIAEPALFATTVPLTTKNIPQHSLISVNSCMLDIFSSKHLISPLIEAQENSSSYLLLYRIIKEICYWTGQEGFQQTLQTTVGRLVKEFDAMEQQYLPAEGLFTRRDALMVIVGLPLGLLAKLRSGSITTAILEEFLAQCTASVVTCWHFLKGTEFHQVESVLSWYLPELEKLAYQPSKYQKNMANLTAQGHLLLATLALHQNNLLSREVHCRRAIQFGQLAEDINLSVTARKWLAVTYYYAKSPSKALQTYQEIEPFIDQVSPLLRGSIYVKMANTYAQCGREQKALWCLRMAYEHFPETPEQDPCFLYADCGRQSLPIWEGLTYLDLGQPEHAWNAFERVEQLSAIITVPERARIEAINHQAEAAIALGDQERFRTYLEIGVNGAKLLASEKRYNEALDVYRQARRAWSHEPRIKALQDLFTR